MENDSDNTGDVLMFGQDPTPGHWYVRDFRDNEQTPGEYAICNPDHVTVAWTDYREDALLIVETMNERFVKVAVLA